MRRALDSCKDEYLRSTTRALQKSETATNPEPTNAAKRAPEKFTPPKR
jgi:hypothetical protein